MIPGRLDFMIFPGDSERLVVMLAEPVMGSTDMTPVILGERELRWRIDTPGSSIIVLSSADGNVQSIEPYGCYWVDLPPEMTSLFPDDTPVSYSICLIDSNSVETWLVGKITAQRKS